MAKSNSALHWIPWPTYPLGVALAGCVAVLLSWLWLPPSGAIAVVGLLVSVLFGLTVANSHRAATASGTSHLETPFLLARDAAMFQRYRAMSESLLAASRNPDPIYREIALEHLDELTRQATTIASGTFVFEGTETWRILYERLLRSPGLHLYRSVAWVKNENYWQDEPGRKSMAVNFELHDAERLNIERIAIIADELWPLSEVWPVEPLRQWLQQQHSRGIWIKFVRESALSKEPELIADIGIYGSRAVGMQELDDDCCTVRFTLTFHRARVTEAESRWTRLAVYAESFSDYLDRWGDAGLSGSNSTNMARLRLHRDRLSRRPSKGFAARLNCGMVQVWVAEPRPLGSGIQCRLGRNPLPNGRGSATHCVTELNHA